MTCKACTEEGVTCVSTGCETFAPSDDKETPPADNSTIIVFVLTTLVALMSLLIWENYNLFYFILKLNKILFIMYPCYL